MGDAFVRLAHLAHSAQGMQFETCTQECTRASGRMGAQPPSRVRKDSVDEREGRPYASEGSRLFGLQPGVSFQGHHPIYALTTTTNPRL